MEKGREREKEREREVHNSYRTRGNIGVTLNLAIWRSAQKSPN